MDQRQSEPQYSWIAAGIALVILYGSFYPFRFYLHHDPRGPLGVLLRSGFRSGSTDDTIANIFLYIPFGLFVAYALDKRILQSIAGATLAGFGLSLFVELAQFYDIGRYQEISDIWSNTLGAFLGAAAAALIRRRVSSVYLTLILGCWFASRCYPGAPAVIASSISALELFRFFSEWLAVGLMLETLLGASRSRIALPLVLAATVAIHAEAPEVLGGAAAALVWSFVLWRMRFRAYFITILFASELVLLALAPFHFSALPRGFGWMPFRSFLAAPTQAAIRVFFEKSFLYGGLLWLMVRTGVSLGAATVFGGLFVFSLRVLQIYLPGRSAEVTDAVLLLMLAAMMKLSGESIRDPLRRPADRT